MPERIRWTEANDLKLRRLRAEGHTWDSIAAHLSLSRWTVIERGRKLGAQRPPPEFKPKPNLSRDPLPAGHRETWGLLTEGTSLDGARYPHPVFQDPAPPHHRVTVGEKSARAPAWKP